ncbi:MAG: DUF695 domain-containing protein [Lysobacter sp.]
MSDHWDFYFCRINDHEASIFLDLGLAREAPLPGLRYAATIQLQMRRPREDGLSSQDEYPTLIEIENHLKAVLENSGTLYIGRCTYNGLREFHFRLEDAIDWPRRAAQALTTFQDYLHQTLSRDDPEWSVYFDFLHPSPEDNERISNRQVCDRMADQGDPLIEPRDIDHWIYFDAATSRDAFITQVAALGFAVRELLERDEHRDQCGVRLYRSDIPSADRINDITLPLFRAALEHAGDYDGWECEVRRPAGSADESNG